MNKNRMGIDNSVKSTELISDKRKIERKKYAKEKTGMDKLKTGSEKSKTSTGKANAHMEKDKECLIEKVDCQSSVNTLNDKDLKSKQQNAPAQTGKDSLDKHQNKKPSETLSAEKKSDTEKNQNAENINPMQNKASSQNEGCVVKEVDSTLSLINIGYEVKEEVNEEVKEDKRAEKIEVESTDQTISDSENLTVPLGGEEDLTGSNSAYSTVQPLESDSQVADGDKGSLIYDISNYLSSKIIDIVMEYPDAVNGKPIQEKENLNLIESDEKTETLNTIENKVKQEILNTIESVINPQIVNTIENEVKPDVVNAIESEIKPKVVNVIENEINVEVVKAIRGEQNQKDVSVIEREKNSETEKLLENDVIPIVTEEKGDRGDAPDNIASDNSEVKPSDQEETKVKNIIKKLKDKGYFLKTKNSGKVLHTGAIYMENKIGLLSLLSVLGLFGIFTDNRAFLGFFGFLYFARYFLYKPDENFKSSLLKAAAPAFFINILFSVFIILLWLLINNAVLFPIGLGIGMAASVIVFAVILAINGTKKSDGDQA